VEFDHALRALRAGEPELADSARLLLAAIGGKVRVADESRFAGIQSEMLRELDRAQEVQQLTTALEALGNLGPTQIADRVPAALADANPVVRAAAARSLARVRTAEALALLGEAVLHDRSAGVRRAALESLAKRARLGLDEDLRGVLAQVAEGDTDAGNRDRAKRLLARA
jgi:HEAT repeat protein